MNTVNVCHPNPALGLPVRKLYNEERMCVGYERPAFSSKNIAFQDARAMFYHAAEEANNRPGRFVLIAWGFVNGQAIDPIGFLRQTRTHYQFTPFNDRTDVVERMVGRAGSASDIEATIGAAFNKEQLKTIVTRGWIHIQHIGENNSDHNSFDRISKLLAHILYKERLTSEELYHLAS